MSTIQVTLYDEEADVELEVCAEYTMQSAEPEVGIPVAYGEIEYVWLPAFGSVIISLEDYFLSEVDEKVADEVWENELERNQ